MAQAQKHWIQAMLGEDSYVPFPYFYDVTAWSGPLCRTSRPAAPGAELRPEVGAGAAAAASRPRRARPRDPAVGVWLTDDGTSAFESEGWLRWLLDEKWRVPYRSLTTPDVVENALAPLDVLLVPNGDARGGVRRARTHGRRGAARTGSPTAAGSSRWRGGTSWPR